MSNQLVTNNLNLGKYSIRAPEESSDIRVGSFWKRRHTQEPNDNQDGRNLNERLTANKRQAIGVSVPTPKRIPNAPRGSVVSQSVSVDSDTQSSSTQPYELSTTSDTVTNLNRVRALEARFNKGGGHETSKQVEKENTVQNSSHSSSSALYIDTQPSSSISRGNADNTDDNTHESVVIEVMPTAYTSNEEDSGSLHQPSSEGLGDFMFHNPNASKRVQKKTYPKQMPYDKIMSNVIFVMSGYENPRRSKLRDLALVMGAKYQPNWNRFCTHLICAFKNTPKYKEVMAENGRIVREHWIQECSNKRQLLDWRDFKLGKYPYPDSEEERDVDNLDYALQAGYGIKQPRSSK